MNQPNSDDARQDLSHFVMHEKDGQKTLHMLVEGMKCPNCAFRIEDVLKKEPDVSARINLTSRRLTLHWQGEDSRGNDLIKLATDLGYSFVPFSAESLESDDKKEERFLLHNLAVSGFASGNIMLLSVALWSSTQHTMGVSTRDLLHWVSAFIALPTVIYAGRPFFRSAYVALSHKRTNMDVPISVALVLTTCMSLFEVYHHGEYAYFDSVVMLLFLLLIGRYLDRRTRGKARAAAEDLLLMMVGNATVLEEEEAKLIPIRDLRSGMLLGVAAGEKIAADGVVEKGISEVDPSFISGETRTQPVNPGTRVFGGMINTSAPITVRITSAGSDSLLGEVIKLMEKAEQGHAQYVRLADRIARLYTPVVHLLAFTTFLIWMLILARPWQPSLLAATTVLIITCPCAIGLAVPAVQILTSGRLFRQGMLLKSADALERMARVDTIIFDKTGTLTTSEPHLGNPQQIGSRNMQMAASLAAHSHHPLAQALYHMYGGKILELDVKETVGQGLEAKWEGRCVRLGRREWCGDPSVPLDESSEIWLNLEGEKPVRFVFVDELRADAKAVVETLQRRGYDLLLLSGDHPAAVEKVAQLLDLRQYRARVSPVEKNSVVEQLRARGRKVLMVGDGLNDAAALSSADVSMSPSSALDITQNAADLVFQGQYLWPIVEALDVARKAEQLVKQNFILSFLYNAIAIPVAMMGLVTPLIAALSMAGSSLLVVLNAQRIAIHRKSGSSI